MTLFSHPSPSRWFGILLKEFIQLKRDRLTFGMIVGIPIMQLVLFGYAINADPKHMPTAVVMADPGPFARSYVAAMGTAITSASSAASMSVKLTACSIAAKCSSSSPFHLVSTAIWCAESRRSCWSKPMPPIRWRPTARFRC